MARSKRKNLRKTDEQPAKRSKTESSHIEEENVDIDKNSLFYKAVTEAGIKLNGKDKQDELVVDQAVFQKKLNAVLKQHPNYPEVVDEFAEGLQQRFENLSRFRLALLPTVTSEECETSHGATQDSLVRLLLGIEIVQPAIANMLLEKLPEMGEDDDRSTIQNDYNIPRLIMNQFRWLDRIVKSKELTQKMMEIVSVTSVDIQREIITCIPEVVDDAEHGEIARELRELLLQNTQLTVAILDALSNLNLRAEQLLEVRGSVLQMLPSAELDDLPVVVKFILQSVSDSEAFEVMCELRENLDFHSAITPEAASTPAEVRRSRGGSSLCSAKDGEVLTLDAIRSGIRFHKSIADGWIKAIESANSSANHKVIDIFVLLILHSTANRKKAVETLFRNKIKSGNFTEEHLAAAFNSHAPVMREYFTDLLSLGEVLLRSTELSISTYACTMYRHSFVSFDLYCRQEVIGALVTHIGSGYPTEADSSLDVLSVLVEKHPNIMAPFGIFIKGILDYLDNLTIGQIRKLFTMLSTLAFSNSRDASLIQDDMHIVIRKQLSSNSPKYKRIGVIGAIMIVKSIGKQSEENSDTLDEPSQTSKLNNEEYKQIINLLDLVRSSVAQSPEAAGLFYDELSNVFKQKSLDPKIEEWISTTVVSDFQDDFLVDTETPIQSEGLPISLMYNLDEGEESNIAVNILPLLLAALQDGKSANQAENRPASLICLAPHFRLLRSCEESQHDGNLEGIDALLGCPLMLISSDVIDKVDSVAALDRDLICGSLFHCLNWFRETINAFSTQSDPEMKVLTRLQTITIVQKQLEKCLAANPMFTPSLAQFDWEDPPPPPSAILQPSTGGKKGRKATNGKSLTRIWKKRSGGVFDGVGEFDIDKDETCKDNGENDQTIMDPTTQKDQGKAKTASTVEVSLAQYKAHFRELDLSVFNILNCGLVSKAVLDSNMNTKETTVLSLQAPQLHFLLDDLSKKLEYSLHASATSRRTFLKVRSDKLVGFSNLSRNSAKDVARFTVEMLPALCEHLETTSGFFQALIAENDGVIDCPGRDTDEAILMASCFQLLFDCLQIFFSWSGFVSSENKPLLKEALAVLNCRTKLSSQSRTQHTFQDILRQSLRYLEQFSSTVPSIASAVTLIRLLVALSDRGDKKELSKTVAELSGNFLKREWIKPNGDKEQGSKFNESVQFLLRLHISCSEDPQATIEEISADAVSELLEDDSKIASSTAYPTLTRLTFPSYYKVMLDELVSHLKTSQAAPVKKTDDIERRLVQLNLSVRIFHILISLVKAFENRTVLGNSLKFGRSFLESFLKLGMPVLDEVLRSHKNNVHSLLKNLQQSTRTLHHICGHSKVSQDLTLTNHIPALKKCLEAFVFRVKAMLTVNMCHEAFWLGNLKNRDISGAEILSQATVQEESAADEEEDEEEQGEDFPNQEGGGGAEDEEDEESCSESI